MNIRKHWTVGVLAGLLAAGCLKTPYTNRSQLILISEAEEDQMGAQAFQEILKKSKISANSEATAMLKRVGQRIADAAEKPYYKWEFSLVEDPKTINAFCLPGGRVAFYTGILPVTQDETGMAVVMAHEVAHALARHGAERMSHQITAGLVEQAAVSSGLIKSQEMLQAVEMAYGVGGALPHSRKQEAEADHIGLILMAKAGYDPRAAIGFWERMSKATGGSSTPVFLSSHPSDKQRIENIQALLPEALKYYRPE